MRYSFLFYLLLICVVITWPGCDPDDDDDATCTPNIPTLDYSDGQCSPTLYQFDDLLGLPGNDGLSFISDCLGASDSGQVIKLNRPPTAGNTVTLHVYNATYGYANIELFGSLDCGLTVDQLSGCFSTKNVAETFTVSGLNAYTDIFVRIDVSDSGPNDPFKEYTVVGDEYISVAAYGEAPDQSGETKYNGYDPEFELVSLPLSCDGASSQRIIMGSCNPDADVRGWQQEVGLKESESYAGDGGVVTAADVPPGMDPNTTGLAVKRRRPRQNTDDFFAEADFILTVPVPASNDLQDAQDKDPSFGDVFECLQFNPGRGSTAERGENIVITMIDGGADPSGNRPEIWNRHINRSIDRRYTMVDALGYDFVRASNDPFDEFGHGTTTAGALIGNYAGDRPLTVIHNKIFALSSSLGTPFGTYFGAVVATQIAGNIGSDFINMSFGLSPEEEPQALRCAVEFAISRGATIITSAGNDSLNVDRAPQWPAAFSIVYFPRLISVASYNYPPGGFPELDPVLSDFSNFGLSSTNLAAYLTAKTPAFEGAVDEFTFLSGTSISAPLFTAAAATRSSFGTPPEVLVASLPFSLDLVNGGVQKGAYLPVCE